MIEQQDEDEATWTAPYPLAPGEVLPGVMAERFEVEDPAANALSPYVGDIERELQSHPDLERLTLSRHTVERLLADLHAAVDTGAEVISALTAAQADAAEGKRLVANWNEGLSGECWLALVEWAGARVPW